MKTIAQKFDAILDPPPYKHSRLNHNTNNNNNKKEHVKCSHSHTHAHTRTYKTYAYVYVRTQTWSLTPSLSCCYVAIASTQRQRAYSRLFSVFDDIAFRLHYRYYACLAFFPFQSTVLRSSPRFSSCVLRRFSKY